MSDRKLTNSQVLRAVTKCLEWGNKYLDAALADDAIGMKQLNNAFDAERLVRSVIGGDNTGLREDGGKDMDNTGIKTIYIEAIDFKKRWFRKPCMKLLIRAFNINGEEVPNSHCRIWIQAGDSIELFGHDDTERKEPKL